MENPQFRELLKKLHLELEHIQSVDQDSKDLLQNILIDINHILADEEHKASDRHLSLTNGLKSAIENFEDTHPKITATMKQLIDTLSNMGI